MGDSSLSMLSSPLLVAVGFSVNTTLSPTQHKQQSDAENDAILAILASRRERIPVHRRVDKLRCDLRMRRVPTAQTVDQWSIMDRYHDGHSPQSIHPTIRLMILYPLLHRFSFYYYPRLCLWNWLRSVRKVVPRFSIRTVQPHPIRTFVALNIPRIWYSSTTKQQFSPRLFAE